MQSSGCLLMKAAERTVFPASWLTNKVGIVGWRLLEIRGYLCQLLSCVDAIALAVLALSICRTVLIWSGLDVHIFYLDSLDSSQMLPFLQWDLFLPFCLAAYIFKLVQTQPPSQTGWEIYKQLQSHILFCSERQETKCKRAGTSRGVCISKLNQYLRCGLPRTKYRGTIPSSVLLTSPGQGMYHVFHYREKMRTKSSSAWSWWERVVGRRAGLGFSPTTALWSDPKQATSS